ncbi:MAG: NlpC/P60 family protein [Maritimibacter sp.]
MSAPTDPRLLKSNGRTAHISLKGLVDAQTFVEGETRQITVQTAALLKSPMGPRERELITGERFQVLAVQGRFSFGFALKDGYVGYVFNDVLERMEEVTHRVSAPRSFRKDTADIKAWEPVSYLSYGAQVFVIDMDETWARVAFPHLDEFVEQVVPARHLTPLDITASDPVAEAKKLLGTPYLWGGNSSFGIDCSGLVQAAWGACGLSLPGDSDLQANAGIEIEGQLHPGDLIFWNGHVAMVSSEDEIIHANAHHMAVTLENLTQATARIKAAQGGDITARRRVAPLA